MAQDRHLALARQGIPVFGWTEPHLEELSIPPNAERLVPRFRLHALGSLSIEGIDAPVPASVTQRKRLAFLALLTGSEPRGIARERLLLLLWPESSNERARAALYQSLYAVRQAFGNESILGTDELRLDPTVVSSDVSDFQAALARGDLAGAVDLYQGPFLDAFHVSGAPELERWVDQKRQELAHSYQTALSRLTTQALERGDFAIAVGYAERLVAADPLSDRATVLLMEALAASGDVASALDWARVHAAVLQRELGAAVDPTVRALVARLRSAAARPEAEVRKVAEVPEVPELPEPNAPIHRASEARPAAAARALRTRWRKWTVALGTAAMLMVAAGLATLRPHDRATEFVVVANFATEPADSGIADILTLSLSRALSASRSLRAAPESREIDARRRLRIPPQARLNDSVARQVALGEGILTVVTGSLRHMGQSYALSIKLILASSGQLLASDERTGVAPNKLQVALDSMSRALRERMGDDLEVIRAQPSLLALTSTSLEAMSNYVAARRAPADSAVRLLREAVALDTSFAMALWDLAFRQETGADERRSLLARAWAHRDGLTEYERLRVEVAYLFGREGITPSRKELVQHLRQIVDQYPNVDDAIILGYFFLDRQQFAAAESTFRVAVALDSTRHAGYVGLINVGLRSGRISAARQVFDVYARRFSNTGGLRGTLLYAEGKRDSTRQFFQDRLATSTVHTRGRAYRTLSYLDLLEGRITAWERDVHAVDSLSPLEPIFLMSANYWVRNRTAKGLRAVDSALAANPANRLDVYAATLYAQFGNTKQARSLRNAHDSVARKFLEGTEWLVVDGWIAIAEGRPREAIRKIRDSQMQSDGAISSSQTRVEPDLGYAFEGAEMPDSAIAVYEHYLNHANFDEHAFKLAWVLEHVARLYDAKGRRKDARAAYARLVDLWKDADPELQPRVAHARRCINAPSC